MVTALLKNTQLQGQILQIKHRIDDSYQHCANMDLFDINSIEIKEVNVRDVRPGEIKDEDLKKYFG